MQKEPSYKKNQPVSVFVVKNKHSWRGKLVKIVEVILIILVVGGTGVWYLYQSHFSLPKFLNTFKRDISPKIEPGKTATIKSPKDDLRGQIEEGKLFEIGSIGDVPSGYEVKAKTGLTVIFSSEKNTTEMITTLQTLLAKAKIENKNIKKVDFRFDKVIVEY